MFDSIKRGLDKVDKFTALKAVPVIERGIESCNGSPYDFGRALVRDQPFLARNWTAIDKIVREHGTLSTETLDEIRRGINDAAENS